MNQDIITHIIPLLPFPPPKFLTIPRSQYVGHPNYCYFLASTHDHEPGVIFEQSQSVYSKYHLRHGHSYMPIQ